MKSGVQKRKSVGFFIHKIKPPSCVTRINCRFTTIILSASIFSNMLLCEANTLKTGRVNMEVHLYTVELCVSRWMDALYAIFSRND